MSERMRRIEMRAADWLFVGGVGLVVGGVCMFSVALGVIAAGMCLAGLSLRLWAAEQRKH